MADDQHKTAAEKHIAAVKATTQFILNSIGDELPEPPVDPDDAPRIIFDAVERGAAKAAHRIVHAVEAANWQTELRKDLERL